MEGAGAAPCLQLKNAMQTCDSTATPRASTAVFATLNCRMTAKLQLHLPTRLLQVQGYLQDRRTSSCTFLPDASSRMPCKLQHVVLHGVKAAQQYVRLAKALKQECITQQLLQAVLQAHELLLNEVVDCSAPAQPQQGQSHAESQRQSQQPRHQGHPAWQDSVLLQRVGPDHRAYQQGLPQHQQRLSVVSSADVAPGQFIGLYLGYVFDDDVYEVGPTVEERAFRRYMHNFSVEIPKGAARCEQQGPQGSSSPPTKNYVVDASDCQFADDDQPPTNPLIHLLDYRAFKQPGWQVDAQHNLPGGANAVFMPYSINAGPCAGQVGVAVVATRSIKQGERGTAATHAALF